MARQSFSYEGAASRARASSMMPCNWTWNTSPSEGFEFAPLAPFDAFVSRARRTVASAMPSSSAMTRFDLRGFAAMAAFARARGS
jgi:hypothetical protein